MKIEISQKSSSELEEMGVNNWSIWECDISTFDWEYSDRESCFILSGEVEVSTEWEIVNIKRGDFVVFPKNLKCVWNVKSPIKKHYNFG